MTMQTGGNGTDGMRQRNLSAVLSTVVIDGPLTRAELARRTGLNRSTVGALVGELLEFGFVEEAYPELTAGVGRPSTVVSVNDGIAAITIRPFPDMIFVELVGLGGTIRREIRAAIDHIPTVSDMVNVSAALIDALKGDLVTGNRLLGVGVAIPGPVLQPDGIAGPVPGLGWERIDLGQQIGEATGLSVLVLPDAYLATLGERIYGAPQSVGEIIYATVDGFGVRAGAVTGGELIAGSRGRALDLGHIQVDPEGIACRCGRVGCLEAEVGRQPLFDLVSGLDAVNPAESLAAALKSDRSPRLEREIDRQVGLFASALASASRVLDPATVVLDGYLKAIVDVLPDRIQPLRDAVAPALLTSAALTTTNVTLGAAQLVFSELLHNPIIVAQRFAQPADDSQHWSRQRLNPALFKKSDDASR